MRHTWGAILAMLVLPTAASADYDWSDSADFNVDARAVQPWENRGYADSTDITVDARKVQRGWADSADFSIGGPAPTLRICGSGDGEQGFVQNWRSVTIDGQAFNWQVHTADETPVGTGPLSAYPGRILGIAATDGWGQPVTDQEALRSAFILTENTAGLAAATFAGQEESIKPDFEAENQARTDNQGTSYSTHRSLVSNSTGSAGEFLEFNNVSGLDNRETRRRVWKHLALEAALQQAIFTRTDAGENGAENHRLKQYAYVDAVYSSAGAMSDSSRLLSMLDKFGNKLPNVEIPIAQFHEELDATIVELNSQLIRITQLHFEHTEVWYRVYSLSEWFANLKDAMSVTATAAEYAGEVYEALALQALAAAEGEDRLLTLKALADAGAFGDPAAAEGIDDAIAAYQEMQGSLFQAWAYVRENASVLDNLDELNTLIETGMTAGQLFGAVLGSHAPLIAQRVAGASTHARHVFSKYAGPASLLLKLAVDIDSTLKVLRQADLALTMERDIKQYLRTHHDLGNAFAVDDVHTLLVADQIRYYLQYWHFEKCLHVMKGEWYDFYKIVLQDPIGGLMWVYSILDSQSMQEAVAIYQEERTQGIQNAFEHLHERGRISQDLWTDIDELLSRGVGLVDCEDLVSLDLSGGVAKWVYFDVSNAGLASDNAFVSVSVPAGIEIQGQDAGGLSGTWTEYRINEGLIYHRNDTTEPTLVPVDTLMEYQGPFPAWSTHRLGLLLQAPADGVYWLRARVAMQVPGTSQYARCPTMGPLDQQGWECIQIDMTSGVDPQPQVAIAPATTFNAVVGEAVTFTVTLNNAGEPSIQTYLDLSHDQGLLVESIVPLSGWTRYLPGSLIWFSDGQQHPALNTLWSHESQRMGATESRSYVLRMRVLSPGTHYAYVRAALRSEDMAVGQFVRYPDSGVFIDQQGYYVLPLTVTAVANQPPVIVSATPDDTVLLRTPADLLDLLLVAEDPDVAPEPLAIDWSLNGSEILGSGSAVQLDVSALAYGDHTLSVSVSDGLLSERREWQLSVVESTTLVAGMTSDVDSQYANTPASGDARRVTFSMDVTEPAGNTSFTYSWSAAVHPVTGRKLVLVSGGGVTDSTAIYATPVSPPTSAEPYSVSCVVVGEQTGGSALTSKSIQVLEAILSIADFNHDGVVDGADFDMFVTCANGPGIPRNVDCEQEDLDNDGDVDVTDFGVFQRHLTVGE